MRQRALLVDVGIALLAAIILLVVSPGLAVTAIVAVVVLLAVAVSALARRVRGRRGPAPQPRRSRPADARPPRRRH